MKKRKVLVTLILIAGFLILYAVIGEIRMLRKERLVQAILRSHSEFTRLTVERMKPGYSRISGTVASTNDIATLRNELRDAGVQKCAILVDVVEVAR